MGMKLSSINWIFVCFLCGSFFLLMYKQELNPKICLKDGLEDFKSFNFGTHQDGSVVFPPKKIGQKKPNTETVPSAWEKVVTGPPAQRVSPCCHGVTTSCPLSRMASCAWQAGARQLPLLLGENSQN